MKHLYSLLQYNPDAASQYLHLHVCEPPGKPNVILMLWHHKHFSTWTVVATDELAQVTADKQDQEGNYLAAMDDNSLVNCMNCMGISMWFYINNKCMCASSSIYKYLASNAIPKWHIDRSESPSIPSFSPTSLEQSSHTQLQSSTSSSPAPGAKLVRCWAKVLGAELHGSWWGERFQVFVSGWVWWCLNMFDAYDYGYGLWLWLWFDV